MTNVLFMGTPEFARDQLAALWENREALDIRIVGVVSQPDKPKGRGYQLLPTPTKLYAEEKGIPVYQPETLKDGAFAETLAQLDPALIVVAAYGKILPPYILDYPKYGCINVHGSLLPRYRGAAPIQRAIMDGFSETGNTIMYMAKGLDTGDMIAKAAVKIDKNEDFGSLYAKMGKEGAKLLIETVPTLIDGTAKREAQNDADATYAAKIEKAECAIDFGVSATALHNRIRALSPAPLAFAVLCHGEERKTLKLVSTEVLFGDGVHGACGEVLEINAKKGYFSIACKEGVLAVTALVPEGKGKMSAGDFIRGRKIDVGDVLIKKEL